MTSQDWLQRWAVRLAEEQERTTPFLDEPGQLRRLRAEIKEAHGRTPCDWPILFGVKDVINVAGLPTQAGSDLPTSEFEGPEATIVTRFRNHGAVVAGKTTTTEFAYSDPSATRNPRNPNHTPGGSSSGSAVAVATGLVPFALGTQTIDSIVTPATFCGVVGFKPTYGRVPLEGVFPFSPSMDTGGVLARDVATTQMAASIMCDVWQDQSTVSPVVLGIPGGSYLAKTDPGPLDDFWDLVSGFADAGFRVVETDALADIDGITAAHQQLIATEFAQVHAELFARFEDRYRPQSAALFREGIALKKEVIDKGRTSGRRLRRSLAETMDEWRITAWISPAAPGYAPKGLEFIGDPVMALPWTHAHLPVVSLPTTWSDDSLPLSVQLIGRYHQDEKLLNLARTVETTLASLIGD